MNLSLEIIGDDERGAGDEGEEEEATTKPAATGGKKKLTNSFNFCERGALTTSNPSRTQETQTIPPPMQKFSANVNAWVIYDSYTRDYEIQQVEKERERERKEKDKLPLTKYTAPKKSKSKSASNEEIARYVEAWKVLERMVNLNTFDEIAKDYRYYEDPSDEYREEEGTLLPLWKFTYDKTKKNTVTSLCWNPYYYDLFVVAFGFLDFMKPVTEGAVCLFALKNPSFPEYIINTESSAMCVDLHPKWPFMLVIGLYNGIIEIYNIKGSCTVPAYRSNSVQNKHGDIVWQVRWAPDLPDGELNFFSIGSDGKVNNWILMPSYLTMTTIINLFLEKVPVPGPDGAKPKIKSCASCFVFHPKDPHIYLVGTEEGLILKCSTAYNSINLMTYHAHSMPVYSIDFNKYNSNIFISCSSDWRVKIWEDNRLEPLYVFDMEACVGDVQWAPYSSTVFACVTTKGKVQVFDINVNKHKAICVQSVVSTRRNKLTRLAFNQKMPILIVGDDKGCVTSLKLSPNLRIKCKPPKKEQNIDQSMLQFRKLEKLLSLVREPPVPVLSRESASTEHSQLN